MKDLLENPVELDVIAQKNLLEGIPEVFTECDNRMLEKSPTAAEVYETLCASNLQASAGTDGIPSLLYKTCWRILGQYLFEVIMELFTIHQPTNSMRTAIMVFSCKPKKISSLKPSDKRRISILCTDFKLYEGLLARCFLARVFNQALLYYHLWKKGLS